MLYAVLREASEVEARPGCVDAKSKNPRNLFLVRHKLNIGSLELT